MYVIHEMDINWTATIPSSQPPEGKIGIEMLACSVQASLSVCFSLFLSLYLYLSFACLYPPDDWSESLQWKSSEDNSIRC